MGNYYSMEEMLEMGRNYIKNVPDEMIIQQSRKMFPQLTSRALSGDTAAMDELFESFAQKSAEYHEEGHTDEAKLLFSTGVFWHDKAL